MLGETQGWLPMLHFLGLETMNSLCQDPGVAQGALQRAAEHILCVSSPSAGVQDLSFTVLMVGVQYQQIASVAALLGRSGSNTSRKSQDLKDSSLPASLLRCCQGYWGQCRAHSLLEDPA